MVGTQLVLSSWESVLLFVNFMFTEPLFQFMGGMLTSCNIRYVPNSSNKSIQMKESELLIVSNF